jgi:hypothetical protein
VQRLVDQTNDYASGQSPALADIINFVTARTFFAHRIRVLCAHACYLRPNH